jgi:hypothetical protein
MERNMSDIFKPSIQKTEVVYSHHDYRMYAGYEYIPVYLGYTQVLNEFEMASTGHRGPFDGSSDKGGPWYMSKILRTAGTGVYDTIYNGAGKNEAYVCREWFPPSSNPPSLPSTSGLEAQLQVDGTSAIARCEPTRPEASVAQFLGELFRDGLPHIIGSGLLKARTRFLLGSTGDEYLNYEFGWKPMMSDLRQMAHAVTHSHEILKSYAKHADVLTRRGYRFPESTDSYSYEGSDACYVTYFGVAPGSSSRITSSKSWFRGAFKYHIPVQNSVLGRFERWNRLANHLLGISLTPETVWELAPWSWAADWFSNAGDVFHNISAMGLDGLVMQYGYMMNEQKAQSSWNVSEPLNGVTGLNLQVKHVQKVRIPATPYGFGISFGDLLGYQQSVIAALGLTRGFR